MCTIITRRTISNYQSMSSVQSKRLNETFKQMKADSIPTTSKALENYHLNRRTLRLKELR